MCVCGRNPAVAKCANCPPGPPGPDGRSIAFTVVAEPAGVNCTYGGWKLTVGYDDNRDGIPDSGIVISYVQNGGPGTPGATPTFIVGTVTGLAPGSAPTVSVVPTANPNEYAINFGIPSGANGATPTLVAGTITTLAFGALPTFTLTPTGTANQYAINLGIPAGAPGAPGNFGTGTMTGVTIPSCLTGILNNGDPLTTVFNYILSTLCTLTTMATQGRPGLFLASVGSADVQVFQADGAGGDIADLILSNDYENGSFDNGNNWSTINYLVPSPPLSQRFLFQGVELEIVETNLVAGGPGIRFEIRVDNVLVGTSTIVGGMSGVDPVGTKYYLDTAPASTGALTTFATGKVVTVTAVDTGAGGAAIIKLKLNKAIFSNQDLF